MSTKWARTTGCSALWLVFSSNKSAPSNRKKRFCTSRLPKNEEIIDGFLYGAANNFEPFKKFKIKKSIAMSFPRPIHWYHSHADLMWLDGTDTLK
jgi:hypothetical protein